MLMLSSVMSSVVGTGLSVLVMGLGWVLSSHTMSDREKNSPFECGFDSMKSARLLYSMRFFFCWQLFFSFLMLSLFWFFPSLVSVLVMFSYTSILGCFSFLVILVVGLFHEWNKGSLDWVN